MVEANKEAVIAIQGGGVYALSLLGQAQAIFEQNYVPLAFAGTSGGAILACLLWSGLKPTQIQAEFTSMVKENPQALLNLLAPFEPPPDPHFNFDNFLDLQQRCQAALQSIPTGQPENTGIWRKAVNLIPNAVNGVGNATDLWNLWKLIQPHIQRRGLFKGDELERTIDKLIRKGFGKIKGMPPENDPITFRNVFELMNANRDTFFRPPLLLTATNLSRRRLELISSVDPDYSSMPIAAAVRASAGFPIFFRPRAFGEGLIKDWLVDGGLISNFPIWTFSDAFRRQVSKSEFYSTLAWRPWVRIGLRVVDDVTAPDDLSKPEAFFKAFIGMLAGAARNQLEDILAGLNTRSIVIKQPTSKTEGPGVLEVGKVDAAMIAKMVRLGYEEAKQELDRMGAHGVYNSKPELGDVIIDRLKSLVDKCRQVMGQGADPKFRANIFIAVQNTLKMIYSVNMDGDSDNGLEFPRLTMGVTGACYQLSTALVCNLEKIAKLREGQPSVYKALFGMPPDLQAKVKKDRTWLMSVPIFDPHEVRVRPKQRAAPGSTDVQRVAISDLGMGLSGPLLGVLNLDAAWDYQTIALNPDPDVHSGDDRIRAISDIMQADALTIGTELAT